MMRFIVILLFIALFTDEAVAQDVQFSQPYNTPLFLNPAFAGHTGGNRISTVYRNQWPGIEHNYQAMGAGADFHLGGVNGGLGITFVRDVAGTHRLSNTLAAFQYSQHIKLSKKSHLAVGVQAGYGQRSFDDSNLFFSDQVINQTSTSYEVQNLFPVTHFGDVSAGVLYYRGDSWLGVSLHHINQPNQSLLGAEDRLPAKFSVHGGWVLPFHQLYARPGNRMVRFLFNYKSQGNWDQLDLGGMYTIWGINLGVWYRGIPLKPYQPGYQNNESIVMLFGYELPQGLGFAYSYDLTISRLAGHSGGAHEISAYYEFNQRPKRPRKRIVPCAKF